MSAVSRRALLQGAGAILVAFSLAPPTGFGEEGGTAPGSLKTAPSLDAWIRVEADGGVTIFTGKAELGQGIRTALIQVAAEQLDIGPERIALVTADTAQTPNEGFTAGSHSMQDSGTAIMNAAAYLRSLLMAQAAARFGLPAEQLSTADGAVAAGDGRLVSYGELAAGLSLHRNVEPGHGLKDPARYRLMGQSVPRVDIPGKVTGGESYVQDLRLPGMVHARTLYPPRYGARLDHVDTAAVEAMPGVVRIVRNGDFLAVAAEREWQAISAMRALAAAAIWTGGAALPARSDLVDLLKGLPPEDYVILDAHADAGAAAKTISARYSRPFIGHGSIGPSCAVAKFEDGALTVWSHTQGVYPLRQALAELMGLAPERVRCIQVAGSGCYGHNGADDAAGDAAMIARELPGRPVRVQWMREQEQSWEPFGPAMATEATASLDAAGKIVDWRYEVWSNPHNMRPGGAAMLLAGQFGEKRFARKKPVPIPMPEGGGDRNGIPLYHLPNARVVHHFLTAMPLRVSALRSLGGYMNVFAIESFMDELAAAAGADPVAFRLGHMEDPRAQDVMALAAEKFGWAAGTRAPGRGRGFAFARYKNLGAYCAVAAELTVDRETGAIRLLRVEAAVDSGQPVNPDGIRNQIEGGILQSASWTLLEAVAFDERRIVSQDWSRYPILRFLAVPESVAVHVIDRPGQPFLGTGEASQGPTAAAIANAVADATGVRLRDLPLSPKRVRATLGA